MLGFRKLRSKLKVKKKLIVRRKDCKLKLPIATPTGTRHWDRTNLFGPLIIFY